MLPDNIFHAYDIRGVYPREINEEVVGEIVGRFFHEPRIKSRKRKIVIGHDARLSSPALYCAAIKNIKRRASAVKILEIGLATTPQLSFLVNDLRADGGIMITASHNPKEYNGLKIVGRNAVSIGGYEIKRAIFTSA